MIAPRTSRAPMALVLAGIALQSCDCFGCEKDADCAAGEYCAGYVSGCHLFCYPERDASPGHCREKAVEGEACCDPEQSYYGNCEIVPCAEGLWCTFDAAWSIPPRCRVRSCADGVRNGNEADVDCGGRDCDPCG